MHAIYNSEGKVTVNLLRAELLSIADMVTSGSVVPVLDRVEALAIELYHYNQSVKRAHETKVKEVSNA